MSLYAEVREIMTVAEQVKILCIRQNISAAELARRLGMSPQNLNAKLKRAALIIAFFVCGIIILKAR